MYLVRDKRVLVTGAAGFVGANLVRALLQQGACVHAVVRPTSDLWRLHDIQASLTVHRADLTNFRAIQAAATAASPHIVFHLAAPSGRPIRRAEREAYLRTCVLGTSNLLEATADLNLHRFVHLGSSTEYGPKDHPMREQDTLHPCTFRGMTKAAATLVCQQFARMTAQRIVVLRSFFIYGPWDSGTPLIPTVIRAVLQGSPIALTATSYRRDFVFVDDVVDACLLALDGQPVPGELINVGSGTGWSNREVADTVQAICDRSVDVRMGAHVSHATDTTDWIADIQKAQTVLGWAPRHTFRQGLEKTVAWFRANQEQYATR
ncbi:MAG TPA: NAD(P)-dependent oxidoreductase [Nitrospiraceae bacterium]|nr:NAD(P)-dependent oxidoreductase [Nitrospiraceae bacterium]